MGVALVSEGRQQVVVVLEREERREALEWIDGELVGAFRPETRAVVKKLRAALAQEDAVERQLRIDARAAEILAEHFDGDEQGMGTAMAMARREFEDADPEASDWPDVTVVRAKNGETPGLPRAYVNEQPPISYRQNPEIWECRRYSPTPAPKGATE